MKRKEVLYDGNYHCGFCGKVFRIQDQAEFLEHQNNCKIAYKKGIKEGIKVYRPYVKALEEENGSLFSLAYVHGYRNPDGFEFGKKCRQKIKDLKKKVRRNA